MLQQSSVLQGTAQKLPDSGSKLNTGPATNQNPLQQLPNQILARKMPQQQISHQPPPPQARRKRISELKENGQGSAPYPMMGCVSNRHQQTGQPPQPFSNRRQGRFDTQQLEAAQGIGNTFEFNQNFHPNLVGTKPSPPKNLKQEHNQKTVKHFVQHQQKQQVHDTVASSPLTSTCQKISNFSAQLDNLANCLNYDQSEICRLFQQKYSELMMIEPQKNQSSEHSAVIEPNLGLLLQLVQQDLLAKQQSLHQLQHHQTELHDTQSQKQEYQEVSNPSQTSEQHSASSTLAVRNTEENVSNDQSAPQNENENQIDYNSSEDQYYDGNMVGCYGADQTEAYEPAYVVDRQYHQFSQSDYVEAVEGFNAEEQEEAESASDGDHADCYCEASPPQEGRQQTETAQKIQNELFEEEDEDLYEQEQNDDDDLNDDEFTEEEHQYTLNELYAQAHKQLLANGLGSKEDIRAWQALYPRLVGGTLTPQNFEQMIKLGQANLTTQQAQEIFNFQAKKRGKRDNQQYQIAVDDDNQQYEWCSQESDEDSNYGDEVYENETQQRDKSKTYETNCEENQQPYQDIQNLVHSTLQPPSHLSPGFKRFFSEFEHNIDFILRWDYEILPQQRSPLFKAEQKRLKTKYENLLTASRDMCRRFTGPHSVLQIFLEKIVASINYIAENLKESTVKSLGLWFEVQTPIPKEQRQNKSTSSSVLTGHHKRSSSADTNLLITKTSKTGDQSTTQNDQQQQKAAPQPQQFTTELKPKPLLASIDNYTQFLEELRRQYLVIMQNCAPKISKHFTKLTAVIVENTQYEFPSTEIHKAVISKLILNDQKHFKQLVHHMTKEFEIHETVIREQHPDFAAAYEAFVREVDEDMRSNSTKIDIYMRDLRKHALDEYEDLYRDEQEQIKLGRSVEGKKKRKKRKRKNKTSADDALQEEDKAGQVPDEANKMQASSGKQNSTKQQNQPKSPQAQKGVSKEEVRLEQPSQAQKAIFPNGLIPEQPGKKKKRNRRNKKKGQDTVTNELLNNLDTDDLVDFINNCGSKKDDLKKQGGSKNDGQDVTEQNEQNPIANQYQAKKKDSDAVINPETAAGQIHISTQSSASLKNEGTGISLSRKQKRELRAASQKPSERPTDAKSTKIDNSQVEESLGPQVSSIQACDDNGHAADARICEDEDGSEAAFAEQLNLFKKSLNEKKVCCHGKLKMSPNVTSEWLKFVRECLRKHERGQ